MRGWGKATNSRRIGIAGELSGTLWGSLGLSGALWCSLWLCGALWGSLWLSGALCDSLGFSGALGGPLGLAGVLGGTLGLFVAFWGLRGCVVFSTGGGVPSLLRGGLWFSALRGGVLEGKRRRSRGWSMKQWMTL